MAEHFDDYEYEYRRDSSTDAEVVYEDEQVIVVADHTGHELIEWAADFNLTKDEFDEFYEWMHAVAHELTTHTFSTYDPVVFDKLEGDE